MCVLIKSAFVRANVSHYWQLQKYSSNVLFIGHEKLKDKVFHGDNNSIYNLLPFMKDLVEYDLELITERRGFPEKLQKKEKKKTATR